MLPALFLVVTSQLSVTQSTCAHPSQLLLYEHFAAFTVSTPQLFFAHSKTGNEVINTDKELRLGMYVYTTPAHGWK